MDPLPQKIDVLSQKIDDLTKKMGDPSQKEKPPTGFGWNVNQYLIQYIGFADTKVSALVAADLAIVVLLLANKPPSSPPFPFLYGLALGLFAISTGAGFVAFYPRVKKEKERKGKVNELIFWRGILSWDEYKGKKGYEGYQTVLQESLTDVQKVEDEYARENYHLSRVLQRKNMAIQVSIICFVSGLPFAFFSTGIFFTQR